MSPSLKNQLTPYTYKDFWINFAGGKPLSGEQLNFLAWHEKTLSFHGFDEMMRYYLKPYHKQQEESHSFLLPHEILNKTDTDSLKKRLQIFLQNKGTKTTLRFKPEEFLQFRAFTIGELILYHGNQFITGAPFYPGGIPYILFFQWGNLFGVAKYVVIADEKALNSNVMVYFESMHERYLDQCVNEYVHTHQDEIKLENKLEANNAIQQSLQQAPYKSPYQIPELTLSRNNEKETEE